MSVISFQQAKQLILDRLMTMRNAMPVSERDMPRYIIGDPATRAWKTLSINDLITNVQMETQLGKSYVYSEVKRLGYAIA